MLGSEATLYSPVKPANGVRKFVLTPQLKLPGNEWVGVGFVVDAFNAEAK